MYYTLLMDDECIQSDIAHTNGVLHYAQQEKCMHRRLCGSFSVCFTGNLFVFFGEGGVGGEDTCASTIKVWTFIAVLLLLMTDRTYMSFTKEPEIVFFS